MGMAVLQIAGNMSPKLHAYHLRRAEQRMVSAKKAGASWAHRTVRGEGGKARIACAAQRQAEAWSRRQIEERCDAYADGLYD